MSKQGKVFHAELWGTRRAKYAALREQDITATEWTELKPQSPFYLFTPQDARLRAEYEPAWSIRDAMNPNGDPAPGIVTTHDQFAISWDADEAAAKVRRLLQTSSEDEAREIWRLCNQSQWNYERAKKELQRGAWKHLLRSILYRPFDFRWTVYDANVAVHRRERVMRHMLGGKNMALISARSNKSSQMDHFFVTRLIMETKCGERTTQSCLLPLYLYPDPADDGDLFANGARRHVNLSPDFTRELEERLRLSFITDGTGDLNKTFGPEDVFHYIYAVLHSPTYRERYAEFLRIDFPRVPLTSDRGLFAALCSRGKELVGLHLLESPKLSEVVTHYPVPGDDRVEKGHPRYLAPGEPEPGTGRPLKAGRVYISKDAPKGGKQAQYFEGVPPDVWAFHIGGYQVCEKWLKDRRGRKLSYDDLEHYQKVVVALRETIRLMGEIDAVIPVWPLK